MDVRVVNNTSNHEVQIRGGGVTTLNFDIDTRIRQYQDRPFYTVWILLLKHHVPHAARPYRLRIIFVRSVVRKYMSLRFR